MSISLLVFLGIQLVSFAVMFALLFEHWRVCRHRELLFVHLNDRGSLRRLQVRSALVALYVLTTLLIAAVSAFVFFVRLSA